ncbi:MAG: M24 family metallopeptidase [Mesorhizobium sp.]|nr:MAG: M24 family metallopeptidase [Mesorhizobium sp.]
MWRWRQRAFRRASRDCGSTASPAGRYGRRAWITTTGHGVGAFLNIHEGPYIAPKAGVDSTTPIELGMLITNEPGYYAADDFGVRIESHMVVVAAPQAGFAGFDTISRLPIDPKLIDWSRLDARERGWLADYHRTVLADVGPLLDSVPLEWLSGVAAAFAAAADRA